MGGQASLLAATCLMGLVAGGTFDLLGRLSRRWSRKARFVADLGLWMLLAAALFGLLWHLAAGQVRFSAFLGMGLGWWGYRRFLAGQWSPNRKSPPVSGGKEENEASRRR
ncbi:MAG: spore cortex biosynthesis protein YabQ [Moorellales bacterium]